MNTRQIIEKYFQCINEQDWDNWLALFDEDVVIDEALSGHMEGMSEVRKSAEGIQAGFSDFKNHIQEIVVEGDKGMVVCRIVAVTRGGQLIESTGANFYRIANGKIVYLSSFHDREPFVTAFAQSQGDISRPV